METQDWHEGIRMITVDKFVSGGRNPNIENCCGTCISMVVDKKNASHGWCSDNHMACVSITGACPKHRHISKWIGEENE